MKKFLLIFDMLLILSACSTTQKVNTTQLNKDAIYTIQKNDSQEQKFINPIFYQPLRPLSSTVGWTYLTPKSIDFRTPMDRNLIDSTGQCELIENEQDHITLLCDITFRNEKWREYYTYFIKDLFMPNCLRILEYNYQKLEDFSQNEMHASKYCVTPPNYTPSESD